MHINSVLSFLGAWQKLQNDHQLIFDEMQSILATLDIEEFVIKDNSKPHFSIRNLDRTLKKRFYECGWNEERALLGKNGKMLYPIDCIKDGVAIECGFAKSAFLLRDIFVKFPLFVQTEQIHLAVVMVPTKSLRDGYIQSAICYFELLSHQFANFYPIPLKYPFVILGYSNTISELKVEELTSEMDRFLISEIGLSLIEMKLLTEKPQYDFKENLPQGKKLSHLVGSMANLRDGGVILIGVNNDGDITGIPRGLVLDDLQLAIINGVQDNCRPRPQIDAHVFDAPTDQNRCVLVVRVHEMEHKPCMVDEKVYVRIGSSTRVAGPDEIRRLFLK